jgi:signal peptidase II
MSEGAGSVLTEPPAPRPPWLRLLVVGALVALDLWSKQAVFEWLGDGPAGMVRDRHGHLRYPLLGDTLTFMLSRNTGAAWGLGGSYPHALVTGRVIAVLVLGWLVVRGRPGPVLRVALVLVLAGALGNLYDNLFLTPQVGDPFGAVRDFIDVDFGALGWDYHFPTFNVADSCITVGAALLLLSGLFGKSEEDGADERDDADAAERSPAA